MWHLPSPAASRLVVDGLCNACRNKRDRSRSGLGGQAVMEEFEAAESLDSLASLTKAKRKIKKSVSDHNIKHHGSKWYVTLHVTFVKRNNVGEEVEHETSFRGEVATLIRIEEYEEQFDAQVDLIMRRIAEFVQMDPDGP